MCVFQMKEQRGRQRQSQGSTRPEGRRICGRLVTELLSFDLLQLAVIKGEHFLS